MPAAVIVNSLVGQTSDQISSAVTLLQTTRPSWYLPHLQHGQHHGLTPASQLLMHRRKINLSQLSDKVSLGGQNSPAEHGSSVKRIRLVQFHVGESHERGRGGAEEVGEDLGHCQQHQQVCRHFGPVIEKS